MSDMRRLINITESFIKEAPYDRPYVPGTATDPNVDWVKTPSGLKRQVGYSTRWEAVPHGNEWTIRAINGDEMMTHREYQAAAGLNVLPKFGVPSAGGVLVFQSQDDAERAIRDYTRAMAARGYTS